MTDAETVRQLRIKMGAVKRMKKEYDFYLNDEKNQRAQISEMQSKSVDHHDIKQVQECLNETLTVLPDTRDRLEKFTLELSKFLEDECDDMETEENGDVQGGANGGEETGKLSKEEKLAKDLSSMLKESRGLMGELQVVFPEM